MPLEYGFPPVAAADARILILGSMPGRASLDVVRYYAHPRNAFWRIMGDLLGAGPELPYEQRLQKLTAAGIALWDVIAACERYGSLDADIVAGSVQANDFAAFFAAHTALTAVFFNGRKAEEAFRRHVAGQGIGGPGHRSALPSTSPANASQSFERRLLAWAQLAEALRP